MTKRNAVTRKIELVETHNIALSLDRLRETYGDGVRWRRALYHAIGMANIGGDGMKKDIREALQLP